MLLEKLIDGWVSFVGGKQVNHSHLFGQLVRLNLMCLRKSRDLTLRTRLRLTDMGNHFLHLTLMGSNRIEFYLYLSLKYRQS